jgi:hypothetical protein
MNSPAGTTMAAGRRCGNSVHRIEGTEVPKSTLISAIGSEFPDPGQFVSTTPSIRRTGHGDQPDDDTALLASHIGAGKARSDMIAL